MPKVQHKKRNISHLFFTAPAAKPLTESILNDRRESLHAEALRMRVEDVSNHKKTDHHLEEILRVMNSFCCHYSSGLLKTKWNISNVVCYFSYYHLFHKLTWTLT